MDKELRPAQIIEKLFEERESWTDEAILAEIHALPVLPDESDPGWYSTGQHWGLAQLYIALADTVAVRRLHAGLLPLLERACYGDPGEMMRGLRHQLEGAVKPDWAILTEVCLQAATSPNRGARLWAINELGVLREPATLQTVVDALHDPAKLVREEAVSAVGALGYHYPNCRESALHALRTYLAETTDPVVQKAVRQEIQDIEEMT